MLLCVVEQLMSQSTAGVENDQQRSMYVSDVVQPTIQAAV
jgi:hypothetical protein